MREPSDDDILAATTRFRRAVDLAGQAPWKAKGKNFPRGCCGHAADPVEILRCEAVGIEVGTNQRCQITVFGGVIPSGETGR